VTLRVVGAGLGRTGTQSLETAFEQLLGAPCYHMLEVIAHPEHIAVWQRAIDGEPPDWSAFLRPYGAAVDWPVAAFWRELSDAFPDAVVVLSVRDADAWWRSAHQTIFEVSRQPPPPDPLFRDQLAMVQSLFAARFTPAFQDRAAAIAAYEAHNDAVRAAVAPDRLVEWHPGDGWAPLCSALDVPVPDEPFPHTNTTQEFRTLVGLDPPDPG